MAEDRRTGEDRRMGEDKRKEEDERMGENKRMREDRRTREDKRTEKRTNVILLERDWKSLLLFLLLTLGIGGLSGFLTSGSMQEYSVMNRPPLAPPGWVFPVVWTILYILMAVAAWLVYEADVPESVPALKLYVAQLLVNGAWPILFFSLHAYYAAFFWIVLLFILAALTAKKFSQINPLAGKLFVPYLLWLIFAGYLNAAIAVLNG